MSTFVCNNPALILHLKPCRIIPTLLWWIEQSNDPIRCEKNTFYMSLQWYFLGEDKAQKTTTNKLWDFFNEKCIFINEEKTKFQFPGRMWLRWMNELILTHDKTPRISYSCAAILLLKQMWHLRGDTLNYMNASTVHFLRHLSHAKIQCIYFRDETYVVNLKATSSTGQIVPTAPVSLTSISSDP